MMVFFLNITAGKKSNLIRKNTTRFTWHLVLQGIVMMLCVASQSVLAGEFVACITTPPCDSTVLIKHLGKITNTNSYEVESLSPAQMERLATDFTYLLILVDAEQLMTGVRSPLAIKYAQQFAQHERQFKFIIINPGPHKIHTLHQKFSTDANVEKCSFCDLDIIILGENEDDIKNLSKRLEQELDSSKQG